MPRLAATAVPATARTRPIPTAVPTAGDGPFRDEARAATPALAVGSAVPGSAVVDGTADADGVGVAVATGLGSGEGVAGEGPGVTGWAVRAGAAVAIGVAAGVGGAVGRGVAGAAGGAGGGTPGGWFPPGPSTKAHPSTLP
jgi:hypothetical protein